MADVSSAIIKQLWYATPKSSWNSLLTGLKELYSYEKITWDQYEDLEYAINKLGSLQADFPDSPGELHQALDPLCRLFGGECFANQAVVVPI